MFSSELFDITGNEYTGDIFTAVKDDINVSFLPIGDRFSEKNLKVSKDELYVGNLHQTTTYDELNDFLSQFGEVDFVNMISDKVNTIYIYILFIEREIPRLFLRKV